MAWRWPSRRVLPCSAAGAHGRHAALAGSAPAGYAELVQGTIVQIELNDLEDPLAYLHGPYRSVQELDDRP
jgi:hypothetical protein